MNADEIESSIEKGFKSYDKYETPIDVVQSAFSCCGYNGVGDYRGKLPISCCPHNFGNANCTLNFVYPKACKVIIEPLVKQFCSDNQIDKLILKISGGVGVFLLTLVIFAATMADKIQDYRRGVYHSNLHNLSFR
ncbi:hypothetical protein HCN44_003083 [Aphidius gifuensis]|uniref:Uncharacterized protein n=1 Tax=Aphidius gifuensis TaxID=684658 RepID=A0A834XJX1_APHGI|nr:hypothetical protein HCN44_003083 [Aphidius gifuensis]